MVLRKTLTIVSLIGLLLSAGLWAVSYLYPIAYHHESCMVSNCAGAYVIECCSESEGAGGFWWDDYHKPANFAQRRHCAHTDYGSNHHDKYERHYDHSQQVDIAGADDVGPFKRAGDNARTSAVGELQCKTINYPGQETREDLPG